MRTHTHTHTLPTELDANRRWRCCNSQLETDANRLARLFFSFNFEWSIGHLRLGPGAVRRPAARGSGRWRVDSARGNLEGEQGPSSRHWAWPQRVPFWPTCKGGRAMACCASSRSFLSCTAAMCGICVLLRDWKAPGDQLPGPHTTLSASKSDGRVTYFVPRAGPKKGGRKKANRMPNN